MIKRGNKKGQFYLIAAIIVIAIIAGIITTTNYVRVKNTKTYNLDKMAQELGREVKYIEDWGIYNELSDDDMLQLVDTFLQDYSELTEEQQESLIFVFGNENKIIIASYNEAVLGSTGISISGVPLTMVLRGKEYTAKEYIPEGKEIEVEVRGYEYKFTLEPGQNFYFVLRQGENVEQN